MLHCAMSAIAWGVRAALILWCLGAHAAPLELASTGRSAYALPARLWLSDVLRLYRISYAVLNAGAPYCHNFRRYSLGVPPLTLADIPLGFKTDLMASLGLGLSTGSSLQFIAKDSPFAIGNVNALRVGDEILSIVDLATNQEMPAAWFFERPIDTLLANRPFRITYRRNAVDQTHEVLPQMICAFTPQLSSHPVPNVEIESGRLFVSRELLQAVSDEELALLISHALAHRLLQDGVKTLPHGEDLEVFADYLAVYLTVQAGFNPSSFAETWSRLAAVAPTRGDKTLWTQHPWSVRRRAMLDLTLREVTEKLRTGAPLALELKRLPVPLLPHLAVLTRLVLPEGKGVTAVSDELDAEDPRLPYVNEVPFLNGNGRAGYQRFLDTPVRPRAFVIGRSVTGRTAWASRTGADAVTSALAGCSRTLSGAPCQVYALNNRVVWDPSTLSYQPNDGSMLSQSFAVRLHQAPESSGFADLHDLLSVPVSRQVLASYQAFLEKPLPRAFVVSQSGAGYYWLGQSALDDALAFCERQEEACWLYAVNHAVVWESKRSKRIMRRDQLPFASDESLLIGNP